MSRLRVLHCPDSVGGHAPGLAAAERELGLDSRCVVFEASPFGYPADRVLRRPGDSRSRFEFRRLRLLAEALRAVDVVHFNFGSTILPLPPRGAGASRANRLYSRLVAGLDLRLLRRLGKGIVVTFQGDDARQGDVLRALYEHSLADEVKPGYYTAEGDVAKRRVVELFDRYAHAIRYLNPDLAHVLPERARFLAYAHVDPRRCAVTERPILGPPLFVHAPSRRDTKGTRYIAAAMAELALGALPVRFELVEGLSNERALRVFADADVLIDQLIAGWYGGVAVEAMALGVPVVAYVREEDLSVIPDAMRAELPLVTARPATVEQVLRSLLDERRAELPEIGERSRRFVERWHDPLAIAAELKSVYESAVAGSPAR